LQFNRVFGIFPRLNRKRGFSMQSKPKRQLGSRANDYLSTIRNPVSADPACAVPPTDTAAARPGSGRNGCEPSAIDRLLSDYDLERRTGRARSTWQKDRLAGNGPPFIRVGRLVRYRQSDFEAWLAAIPSVRSTSEVPA
jgi:hypothetical protein